MASFPVALSKQRLLPYYPKPIVLRYPDIVDSAVQGIASSSPKDAPKDVSKDAKRRQSSAAAPGVFNVNDLQEQGIELEIAQETQKLGWKINTSPSTIDDKEYLKKLLTTPPVKKIDLHFPLGLEVTARNLKGVTIKDAMDAIHKQYKKKADDELDQPYLAGFEWDKEESWTRLVVHLQKDAGPQQPKSKKKKGNNNEEGGGGWQDADHDLFKMYRPSSVRIYVLKTRTSFAYQCSGKDVPRTQERRGWT
ncbi:hypothetical protein P8C59_008972 [Phyllachora maydis]|uniref:DUF6699 domain-containing protein n=1 Tax=Phyllachora maydis TaxID=1825666 RepID=A0AAD9MKK5_9PEZI|nr:hypothetical protein P8C59_008972 [Phyllachora maydis]